MQPAQLPEPEPQRGHLKLSGPIHHQQQSPLFSLLPAEVRNHLFSFCFLSFNDPTKPACPTDTLYTRPGYSHPQTIAFAFLQSCRRTCKESYLLPVIVNKHTVWLFHGPPDKFTFAEWSMDPETGFCRYRSPFSGIDGMTREQQTCVGEIHIFTTQLQLERSVSGTSFTKLVNVAHRLTSLTKMVLTIRHSDWCGYKPSVPNHVRKEIVIDPRSSPCREMSESERDIRHIWTREDQSPSTSIPTPLDAWGSLFKSFEHLDELEIEVETDIGSRQHLETILERALRWTFEVDGGEEVLRTNRESIVKSKWQGPKCMKPIFRETLYRSWPKGMSDFQIRKRQQQEKEDWENAPGPILIVAKLRWTLLKAGPLIS